MYEEEGEQLAGSYASFFAEGENLAKKKEFKKAIESFTKVENTKLVYIIMYIKNCF